MTKSRMTLREFNDLREKEHGPVPRMKRLAAIRLGNPANLQELAEKASRRTGEQTYHCHLCLDTHFRIVDHAAPEWIYGANPPVCSFSSPCSCTEQNRYKNLKPEIRTTIDL